MIKIGFVGDIFPGGSWAQNDGLTGQIVTIFEQFDLRVANLETAFGDGSVQCHVKMADSQLGNTLFCPDECVEILKKLHIDVVSLANNHTCDCDLQGLLHTIDLLDKNGIKHFGAGRNKMEAEAPAIIEIKGKKIGFLGYFPPEWEAPYPPTETIGGLNQFKIEKVINDVVQLRNQCDYVFVMPHWGWEYTICPRYIDVINAKKIIGAGATGVLGAHTHTVQPVIKYEDSVMAMSLGNFIFPDRYIAPPRKTYYPIKEEIQGKAIPYSDDFKIVDELTLMGMPPNSRIGLICAISLEKNEVNFQNVYVRMSIDNVLEIYRPGGFLKIKLWIMSILIRDKKSILYRLFSHIRHRYNRMLDLFHIKHPR